MNMRWCVIVEEDHEPQAMQPEHGWH